MMPSAVHLILDDVHLMMPSAVHLMANASEAPEVYQI